MADFTIALHELLGEEGGYANNSSDAGGETVFGIARKFNPTWIGWQLVDPLKQAHQNLKDLNAALSADTQLQTAVAAFYRQAYWNFDNVQSQAVANKMFEMEVNFGRGAAVKILQQGLVRLGHAVNLDGSLGPSTYAAMSNANEPELLHALRAYSALHRVHVVLAHPDQIVNVEGWLWRDTA
jgi:lysozyme family protein